MDVVEAGPQGRGGPRRWVGVLAGAVLVALVGGAIARNATHHEPAARPSSSASPSDDGLADVIVPSPAAAEWDLPPLTERTGLYAAGVNEGLAVANLDTGRRVANGRSPAIGEGAVQPIARVAGGWLVYQGRECGEYPCEPARLFLYRDGRPVAVGVAEEAKADPDGQTFWATGLTDLTSTATPERNVPWLEHRTATGRLIGRRTLLRPKEQLLGVTPEGPVVGAGYSGDSPTTLVRSASRSRRVVLPKGVAYGAAGHAVVSGDLSCQADDFPFPCVLRIADVRGGAPRTVETRLDGAVMFSAVDPTGRYLAVSASVTGKPTFRVVDLGTGRSVPLLGIVDSSWVGAMTWSPDGRWLVLTHEFTDPERDFAGHHVAVWRPGWDRPRAAPDYPSAFGDDFVVSYAR
ncbi:MAG: hypothetical protein QOE45_1264 [Frankiaceae bacterium]|jgi:hypothetical protein|nr:hypothetical protein [Frankiaceae bacterium]